MRSEVKCRCAIQDDCSTCKGKGYVVARSGPMFGYLKEALLVVLLTLGIATCAEAADTYCKYAHVAPTIDDYNHYLVLGCQSEDGTRQTNVAAVTHEQAVSFSRSCQSMRANRDILSSPWPFWFGFTAEPRFVEAVWGPVPQ